MFGSSGRVPAKYALHSGRIGVCDAAGRPGDPRVASAKGRAVEVAGYYDTCDGHGGKEQSTSRPHSRKHGRVRVATHRAHGTCDMVSGLPYEVRVTCPAGEGAVTDATIPPPKVQRFYSTNIPWLLDTRKDTIKKEDICLKLYKGLSIDNVGVSRDTIF